MTTAITLYTAHHCPYAHRVQIAIRELGLGFDTSLVDILSPRTPEYLALNASGMVPTLVYDGLVLKESISICQFLVDRHISHLLKPSAERDGALQRYEIGMFVNTFFDKVQPAWNSAIFAFDTGVKASQAQQYVDLVVEHIEPLLGNAAPFFGGSDRMTFAEVLIGPFLVRTLTLPKYEQLIPNAFLRELEAKAPKFFTWANKVAAEKTVLAIWDEDLVVKQTMDRLDRMRKQLV